MIETKRKKGETFESFLRRFNKRLMQSGVILEFKSKRYLTKKVSRNLQKESALVRQSFREKMDYLRSTGKLTEEQQRGKRRY
jgi:ribosomal protein S21